MQKAYILAPTTFCLVKASNKNPTQMPTLAEIHLMLSKNAQINVKTPFIDTDHQKLAQTGIISRRSNPLEATLHYNFISHEKLGVAINQSFRDTGTQFEGTLA